MIDKKILRKYNYQKEQIENLIEKYRRGDLSPEDNIVKGDLEYPSSKNFVSLPPEDTPEYKSLYREGMQSIEKGELAVCVLNGGMGTRFGGVVKGTVDVYDGRSFLELKVKNALEISDKIKFFVMNSYATERKTKKHFQKNDYFGFSPEKIRMFNQFIAPRILKSGEYFSPDDERKAYYGPGHGDFPYAFKRSGVLKEFLESSGKYIFLSNVDNLGATVEPAILGFHIRENREMTAEVAQKSKKDEGGAPILVDGKLVIVESFRIPRSFDVSKIPVFNCNSYWINAESLEKDFSLPRYMVEKKSEGKKVIQFEHICGDMSAFLKTSYLKVSRNKRFFPIKRPRDLERQRETLKKITGYSSGK